MPRYGLGLGVSHDPIVFAPLYDIYIDSVNGNNANDGLTAETAKRTLSEVVLADRMRVGLACGSHFHEMFEASGFNNLAIAAYGEGRKPIVDCADEVGTWTKTVGRTSVYQQTISHEVSDQNYLSLWEDGVRPVWVASVALCDATAGTWFTPTADATGSSTIYVHPYDSTDARSDGKLYEMSMRNYAVTLGSSGIMRDIHTRRNGHNNGSTIIGTGARAYNCIFEDGVKHNAFGGGNTEFHGCISYKSDWPTRDNATMFVAYADNAHNMTALFENCVAIGDPAVANFAIDHATDVTGFYAHTSGIGTSNWLKVTHRNCTVLHCGSGYSVAECEEWQHINSRAEGCHNGLSTAADLAVLTDIWIASTALVPCPRSLVAGGGAVIIDGARIYNDNTDNETMLVMIFGDDPFTMTNSVLYRDAGETNYGYGLRCMTDTSEITFTNNIVYLAQDTADQAAIKFFNDSTIDNNVYGISPTLDYQYGTDSYANWAAYRAALPQFDVHSVNADPLLGDVANGDFSISQSSPAIALGAGLLRPDVVYTPSLTFEQIEAM